MHSETRLIQDWLSEGDKALVVDLLEVIKKHTGTDLLDTQVRSINVDYSQSGDLRGGVYPTYSLNISLFGVIANKAKLTPASED